MPRPHSDKDDGDNAVPQPRLHFPMRSLGPLRSIAVRLLIAVGALVVTTVIVYSESPCFQDRGQVGTLTWIDAFYYATVTLSTTGYGDITPVCESSRLVNAIVITPLRFLFLIVLVGTTIEVLTRRTRDEWRRNRWRKRVDNQTIIIGFGVKGRAAASALVSAGMPAKDIVVVSDERAALDAASRAGFVGVEGDARREATLKDAAIERASQVIVAVDEDDTTILITLTARKLNKRAKIVVAVRESENIGIMRESGADSVIPTAESSGRLMGLSLMSRAAGQIMEDLLDSTHGLDIQERAVAPGEVGLAPLDLDARGEIVLAVVRDGVTHRFDANDISALKDDDRLVVIQHDGS